MSITNVVLKKMEATMNQYNMINENDKVVIGVSGGADSIMLLHTMLALKTKYKFNLVVAHINHKIRTGDAENDALFVENLCKKHNVEFHLKEAYIKDLAKEWNMGEEEAGRKVRYSFFSELAGENGKIATAHNANDNAETLLMRIMRGTGLKGLGGIQYTSKSSYGTIIRPILDVTRQEVEDYLKENNIEHITDKTNFEEIYTRNKIRLNLIPYIKNTFNPNFVETINKNIKCYKEDNDFFEVETEKAFNQCIIDNDNDNITLNIDILKSFHPAIIKRVIIKSIQMQLNINQDYASAQKIEEIMNILYAQSSTVIEINKNLQSRISYNNIIFENKEVVGKKKEEENFLLKDNISVEYNGLMITTKIVNITDIINTPTCFYLPYDEYKNKTLTLRNKKNNDSFRIKDNMHKSLSKYMSDKKIDLKMRNNVLLVCDENEVLCAINHFVTRFNKRNGKFIQIIIQ